VLKLQCYHELMLLVFLIEAGKFNKFKSLLLKVSYKNEIPILLFFLDLITAKQ
jgi:hypothetical protein